ncbi:MAG: ABC transporter substrate-binding protein [Flavobacteriaceae bacterium]|nr:ABC transporter substrate-binding protein [Flavobacteriaceae bacterium]
MKKIQTIILLSWLIIGCTPSRSKDTTSTSEQYAQGFSIESKATYDILILKNIVPNSQTVLRYLLIADGIELPKGNTYDGVIRTPVKQIIAGSTTHVAFLEELDAIETLVGFPETDYISSASARKRIGEGKIIDVGKSQQLNVERILELNPDLILSFGVESIDGSLKRFNKMGIPSAFIGEWNEQNPLGRAEWIKVFGALLGKKKEADERFKSIEEKYIEIQNSVPRTKTKPTILAGAIYQDAWYLPGGDSYLAQLFEDANTNYLWKGDTQTGSLALSIETVLEKGQQADYWFAPGQHTSYFILEEEHVLYSKFKATQTKRIFTYARSKGSTGGLLFFESGATRPDLVLKDIIHHLYPELYTAYVPTYFLPLDD